MNARTNKTLLRTQRFKPHNRAVARLTMASLLPLLVGGMLILTSCQGGGGNDGTGEANAPEENAPMDSNTSDASTEADPDTATPTEPAPPTSDPEANSPTEGLQSPGAAALPETLLRQWEPASSVLFTFGPMTITPSEVQWESGQSSPYTIVSMNGGYLLELESSPSFYDTPNPLIKLIPKTDEAGNTTSLDIAFYESQGKADSEEYIMYGSYFVE
jgi:hypothetical protein